MLRISAVIICNKCQREYHFAPHPLGERYPVYPDRLRAQAAHDGWKSSFQNYTDICPKCIKEIQSNIQL